MPGRKSRTNPFLIFLLVLMCLAFGATLTQSSANPSPLSEGEPDMFVAEEKDNSAFTSESSSENAGTLTDGSDSTDNAETVLTPTPEPTPTEIPKPTYSPQADQGTWVPSGSKWLFMVDGVPITGWFTDKDGKQYYFNSDGIMQTGWLEDGGKRYYLNLDGIMQKGTITVDGETYELLEDGSLKGYQAEVIEEPKSDSKENTETAEKAEKTKKKKKKKTETTAQAEQTPQKTIALTFDDGPSSYTNRLLDCLEANNAKATFFMVGTEIENFPDEVRRMEKMGCEIGNHTYTHADLTSLSPEEMNEEIGATDQLLLDLVGHGATVVRPPYGSINDSVSATVGTPMILWSVDTLDWKTLDVQQTVDTVLSEATDGGIILMHDIYKATVDAAEIIIPELISQGYELVTIHELAAAHGVELQTGIGYGSMDQYKE